MIKEVIQVISTEQKQGTKGPYLEVSYRDEKGTERKKNIFDQTLWNLFGEGLWVEWQLEKEGTWWNVKSAQGVEAGIAKLKEAPPPSIRENMEWKQENIEKSFWWNQVGGLIRADKLEEVFGEKDAPFIQRAYKLQAIASLGITKKED